MVTSTPPRRIGERIKWARLRAGLTQDEMGAAMGTTRQIIIGWEKGRHRPQLRYRRLIAEATRIPDLFADEDGEEEG